MESIGPDPFERNDAVQLLLLCGENFSQTTLRVMSLRPVSCNGVHGVGYLAPNRTVGIRLPRGREQSVRSRCEHRTHLPKDVDPGPQLFDEFRAFGAQLLGADVASLPVKLVPLDQEFEQAIFDGCRCHERSSFQGGVVRREAVRPGSCPVSNGPPPSVC